MHTTALTTDQLLTTYLARPETWDGGSREDAAAMADAVRSVWGEEGLRADLIGRLDRAAQRTTAAPITDDADPGNVIPAGSTHVADLAPGVELWMP
jgi:hypothetical protein